MPVELNKSVGNFSTSRKSGLLRWASRCASLVLIEFASMDTSTRELAKSSATMSTTPVTVENCPFTLEIIICLTLNSAVVWTGSMFHFVTAFCFAFADIFFPPSVVVPIFVGITSESAASFAVGGRKIDLRSTNDYVAISLQSIPEVSVKGSEIIFVGMGSSRLSTDGTTTKGQR